MGERAVREALAPFGLAAPAVDVYLALLRRGEATPPALVAATDHAESTVVEATGDLADRGLVDIADDGGTTTVLARPPAAAVDDLSSRVSRLEDAATDLYEGSPATGDDLAVVRSAGAVERRLVDLVAEADDELFAILPSAAFEAVADELAAAVERGVFVQCMVAAPDGTAALREVDDPGRYAHVVRTWDARPPLFVVADDSTGVLAMFGALRGESMDDYAVAFDQPEVASGFYGNYLSNVWPMGQQRYVVEPPELPATYDRFRSWAVAAALHQAAGRDLLADVVARDVATGDQVEHERARVREVRQQLVEPWQHSFPTEVSLVIELPDGLATVGGETSGLGPYYEEYAAAEITLHEA